MQAPDPDRRPDAGGRDPGDDPPQARPVPDEPGPHDVPDEQVIDKTLPARPVGEGGSDLPRGR